MEERLIRRAEILLGRMTEEDAAIELVESGVSPEDAYLAIKAAGVRPAVPVGH